MCRGLPMSGDLRLHVVYRDRFKNVSFWSFAVCDANWTQQIRLCLQHATVVTSLTWRRTKRRLQTVGRSRSLLKVTDQQGTMRRSVAQPVPWYTLWVLLRGDCTGQSPGLFVCLFVYVLKDFSISEYTNTVETRCHGFRRFVITHVILMFRPVVNSSDESGGGGPRFWQVDFLSLSSSPADRCQQADCFRALQAGTVLHPLNAFALDTLSKCLHLTAINVPLLYVMRIYFLWLALRKFLETELAVYVENVFRCSWLVHWITNIETVGIKSVCWWMWLHVIAYCSRCF